MKLWCIWNEGKPNGKNDRNGNENAGNDMVWNGCPSEYECGQNSNVSCQVTYAPQTPSNSAN